MVAVLVRPPVVRGIRRVAALVLLLALLVVLVALLARGAFLP